MALTIKQRIEKKIKELEELKLDETEFLILLEAELKKLKYELVQERYRKAHYIGS